MVHLRTVLLGLLLAVSAHSICNSTTFWNPLNNACVGSTSPSINSDCPWEYPNLYYAESSTKSCVLTCPTTPSSYANDYTQSCTTGPPFIYYL